MAIAFASFGGSSNTSTVSTITKPTGLAVGDLMIAHVTQEYATPVTTPTMTMPSGFIQLDRLDDFSGAKAIMSFIAYKVADAGDVAASTFAFTSSKTASYMNGYISRITGQRNTLPIDNFVNRTTTADPITTTTSITPKFGNSLMIIANSVATNHTLNVSAYAIDTDNPTWAQAYNAQLGAATGLSMALGYANRSQSTPTGNSYSAGSSSDIGAAHFIVIDSPQAFTYTGTDVVTTPDTVTALRAISLNVGDTVQTSDSVLSDKERVWTNEQKPDNSIWINEPK